MSKTVMQDITCKLFSLCFHTCQVHRHCWPLPFCIVFSGLTLSGGHKVSRGQNLMDSSSYTCHNSSRWNLKWCWHNWSWPFCGQWFTGSVCVTLYSDFCLFVCFVLFCFLFLFFLGGGGGGVHKRNSCCFLDCVKKLRIGYIWMFMSWFLINMSKI